MIKHLVLILQNRAKTKFIDYLIEVLIGALQEYRRKDANGEFDTNLHNGDIRSSSDNNRTSDILKSFK